MGDPGGNGAAVPTPADPTLQSLYAEARGNGLLDADPQLHSLMQEGVKNGLLTDLSGGSNYGTAKAAPASTGPTGSADLTGQGINALSGSGGATLTTPLTGANPGVDLSTEMVTPSIGSKPVSSPKIGPNNAPTGAKTSKPQPGGALFQSLYKPLAQPTLTTSSATPTDTSQLPNMPFDNGRDNTADLLAADKAATYAAANSWGSKPGTEYADPNPSTLITTPLSYIGNAPRNAVQGAIAPGLARFGADVDAAEAQGQPGNTSVLSALGHVFDPRYELAGDKSGIAAVAGNSGDAAIGKQVPDLAPGTTAGTIYNTLTSIGSDPLNLAMAPTGMDLAPAAEAFARGDLLGAGRSLLHEAANAGPSFQDQVIHGAQQGVRTAAMKAGDVLFGTDRQSGPLRPVMTRSGKWSVEVNPFYNGMKNRMTAADYASYRSDSEVPPPPQPTTDSVPTSQAVPQSATMTPPGTPTTEGTIPPLPTPPAPKNAAQVYSDNGIAPPSVPRPSGGSYANVEDAEGKAFLKSQGAVLPAPPDGKEWIVSNPSVDSEKNNTITVELVGNTGYHAIRTIQWGENDPQDFSNEFARMWSDYSAGHPSYAGGTISVTGLTSRSGATPAPPQPSATAPTPAADLTGDPRAMNDTDLQSAITAAKTQQQAAEMMGGKKDTANTRLDELQAEQSNRTYRVKSGLPAITAGDTITGHDGRTYTATAPDKNGTVGVTTDNGVAQRLDFAKIKSVASQTQQQGTMTPNPTGKAMPVLSAPTAPSQNLSDEIKGLNTSPSSVFTLDSETSGIINKMKVGLITPSDLTDSQLNRLLGLSQFRVRTLNDGIATTDAAGNQVDIAPWNALRNAVQQETRSRMPTLSIGDGFRLPDGHNVTIYSVDPSSGTLVMEFPDGLREHARISDVEQATLKRVVTPTSQGVPDAQPNPVAATVPPVVGPAVGQVPGGAGSTDLRPDVQPTVEHDAQGTDSTAAGIQPSIREHAAPSDNGVGIAGANGSGGVGVGGSGVDSLHNGEAPGVPSPARPNSGVDLTDPNNLSPKAADFATAWQAAMGVPKSVAEATAVVANSRAITWAQATGNSPEQWFDTRIAELRGGNAAPVDKELSSAAAAQSLSQGEAPTLPDPLKSPEHALAVYHAATGQMEPMSPEAFSASIQNSPSSASLNEYSPEESQGIERYKLKGADISYGIKPVENHPVTGQPERDIVGVVNNESNMPGVATPATMLHAIQHGATTLDAWDVKGFLPDRYARFGFQPIGREPYNTAYGEPSDALKHAWKAQGWKEGTPYPDVVYMKYGGLDGNGPDRRTATSTYLGQGTLQRSGDSEVSAWEGRGVHQGDGITSGQVGTGEVRGGSGGASGSSPSADNRRSTGLDQPQEAVGGRAATEPAKPDSFQRAYTALTNLPPEHLKALGIDPEGLSAAGGKTTGGTLNQSGTADEPPRATISFMPDGRSVIQAMQNPDASTGIHDLWHIFRRDVYRDLDAPNGNGFTDADRAHIEEWAGVKNVGAWRSLENVEENRAAEEKFAEAGEQYVGTGKAPTPKLQAIFDKFKQWLHDIYGKLAHAEIDISPQMKDIFDRLVGNVVTSPEHDRNGQSASHVPSGEAEGVDAAESTAEAKTPTKSTPPDMAGSLNTTKLPFNEEETAQIHKDAEALGLTDKTPKTLTGIRDAARLKGLSIADVRTATPGLPPKVWTDNGGTLPEYATRLKELYVHAKTAEIAAQKKYETNPTDKNKKAFDQTTADRADMQTHADAFANSAGLTLAVHKLDFQAFQGAAGKSADEYILPSKGTPPSPKSQAYGKRNKFAVSDPAPLIADIKNLVGSGSLNQSAAPTNPNVLHQSAPPATELHQKLAELGAHYIEAGTRRYEPWKATLQKALTDAGVNTNLTEGDYQSIFANAREYIENQVQAAGGTPSSRTALVEQLTPVLGRSGTAAFINNVHALPNGLDIFDRFAQGGRQALTETENDQVTREYVNAANTRNAAKSASAATTRTAAMSDLIDMAKPIRAEEARARLAAARAKNSTAKSPTPAATPEESFRASLTRYNDKGKDAFTATLGPALTQKLAAGGTPTAAEEQTILDAHNAAIATKTPGTPKPSAGRGVMIVRGIIKDAQAAARKAGNVASGKSLPTDTAVDRYVKALPLGSVESGGRQAFRAAVGEPLLEKHVGGTEELTDAERDKLADAYIANRQQGPKQASEFTDANKVLNTALRAKHAQMAKDARESMLPKQRVKEQILNAAPADEKGNVDPAFVSKLNDDMSAIETPGAGASTSDLINYHRKLGNLLSEYSASMGKNLVAAYRAGLLSGPQTLGKIGIAHLLYMGAEDIKRAPAAVFDAMLARRTGVRTVQGMSAASTGRAIGSGAGTVTNGDAATIMRGGDAALTLAGKNHAADPMKPISTEFAMKGKAGAVVNPVVRTSMRLHGVMYHAMYTGAYERGMDEWANLEARKQLKDEGKAKPSASDLTQRAMFLRANHADDGIEFARKYADEQTFRNDTVAGEAIKAGANKFRELAPTASKVTDAIGGVAVPFNKVPTNIGMKTLEYGAGAPYATARAATRLLFSQPITEEEQRIWSNTFGRGATGAGMMVLGYGLATGAVAGLELLAPDRSKYEYGSVAGKNAKVGISQLQPIATAAEIGAAIREAQEKRGGKFPVAADVFNGEVGSVALQELLDNPYVRASGSLGDLAEVLSDEDPEATAAKKAGKLAGVAGGEWIANLVAAIAAQTDPGHVVRKKSSALDYVKNRIPGLRGTLPPMIGADGRPVPESTGIFSPLPVTAIPPETAQSRAYEKKQSDSADRAQILNQDAPSGQKGTPDETYRLRVNSRIISDEKQDASVPTAQVAAVAELQQRIIDSAVSKALAAMPPSTPQATRDIEEKAVRNAYGRQLGKVQSMSVLRSVAALVGVPAK